MEEKQQNRTENTARKTQKELQNSEQKDGYLAIGFSLEISSEKWGTKNGSAGEPARGRGS